MYKALSPGAISVRTESLEQAIEAAVVGGFQGVEFNPAEVAQRIKAQSVESVVTLFSAANIKPAGFGLPIDWRSDVAAWQAGMERLPELADAASAIGGGRTMTWIMPCSNEKEYAENFRFHRERLKPIAKILADNGCQFGLEFIGTKSLRLSQKFPFIWTLKGMLELADELGENVGILLDCWHWHTSEGTVADIQQTSAAKVVYVHVNDAPQGVAMEDYLDNVRGLPAATGVIDIVGFLQALQSIGYQGAVTPEPFAEELRLLPNDAARLKTVGESMDTIFRMAHIV